MTEELLEMPVLEFYLYPSLGPEDWRYVFATAEVKALETRMLDKAIFSDMAGASDFQAAAEMLSGTDYTLGGDKSIAAVEQLLIEARSEQRKLFEELMVDEEIVKVFKARSDFANMRLALRRILTEKPVGLDYCDDGNVSAELFEEVFEQENYDLFTDYMQDAVEQAVLRYYQKKDIRQIDYAVDSVQAQYNLKKAHQLQSVFLRELFRMQIDLTNIRTMLRIKWSQSEVTDGFVHGGYIEQGRLIHSLELAYEALPAAFAATPYYDVIEPGAKYLADENSFLRLEQCCESHLVGFLRSTLAISAGPQPVIAYLLNKELEIRTVRMVLTAKRNNLGANFILDRLAER